MNDIYIDTVLYLTCRLVHWGPLYKAIHKKHHEWTAPVGVVAVYAHPFEYILSNVTPFVMGPLIMRSHMATTWLWYALAVTTTVCHHCGYHLPLLPSPEFHDFHHLKWVVYWWITQTHRHTHTHTHTHIGTIMLIIMCETFQDDSIYNLIRFWNDEISIEA